MLHLNAKIKQLASLLSAILFLHTIGRRQIFVDAESITHQSIKSTSTSSNAATNSDYPLEQMQKNAKRPPMNGTNGPSRVLIGIYIESMGNFQAADMSFDVDLYLYSHWRDPSLRHSNNDYVLMTDPKVRERIWLPDLYFANARTSKFHDVTIPNFSLFIDREGNIAYSTRVTLNVACNLELANYPMDSQTCGIRMVSYAYVASQVNVSWFKIGATRYNPEIGLPEFKIVRLTPESCDGSYMYAIMANTFKYDRFSCLEAVIHLNRQIGYHVVQSFIPTGLIVMISWVSFWIDRRAVPARVTLSFTTLLSLSTLGNGLRFNLPQVAYAKAIDFWFGSCMFFVFLSLVEFAAVNSYMREAEKFERLASYSAKKEMTNEEGNPWVYSDDDDLSSTSRSAVLPSPSTDHKNGKKKRDKMPSVNNNNNNNKTNKHSFCHENNEMMTIGAKMHNWTNHTNAVPPLYGQCAESNDNNNNINNEPTKYNNQHYQPNKHHQNRRRNSHQPPNGPMRLIRHPSILADRILTVEHFEQLADKRLSNSSSQGKSSAKEFHHRHHNHNHPSQKQQHIAGGGCAAAAAFVGAGGCGGGGINSAAASIDLRSIDADDADSLLMMEQQLQVSPARAQPQHRIISALANRGSAALPPLSVQTTGGAQMASPVKAPPLCPATKTTTATTTTTTTTNRDSEEGEEEEKEVAGWMSMRHAGTAPVPGRKRPPPVLPAVQGEAVPIIQPWPPSPMMAQDGKAPPLAPRRKEQPAAAEAKEADHLLMATNHFLREGFRYSRKGLFIDKWSRLLFPLAFTLWNTYYWTYYLWFIQRHSSTASASTAAGGSGDGGGGG